jgi:hypothetical protein
MRNRVALITTGTVALLGGFLAWYSRPIVSVRRIGVPWQATLHQSHCARGRGEAYCTTGWPPALGPPMYSTTIRYKPLTRELLRADRTWNHSVRALSVGFYTAAQIDAALNEVFGVDTQLIADGTHYVVRGSAGPAAAGGWSARHPRR